MDYKKIYESCLNEGVIKGAYEDLVWNKINRHPNFEVRANELGKVLWVTYKDSSIIKNHGREWAFEYKKLSKEFDEKDATPLDARWGANGWGYSGDGKICYSWNQGKDNGRSGIELATPVYMPVEWIFKKIINKNILQRIDKEYQYCLENCDPHEIVRDKKFFFNKVLNGVKNAAEEDFEKAYQKHKAQEEKWQAKQGAKDAKKAVKNKSFDDLKSEYID